MEQFVDAQDCNHAPHMSVSVAAMWFILAACHACQVVIINSRSTRIFLFTLIPLSEILSVRMH